MTTRSACCSTLRWAIAATLASGCAQIHKLAGQIDKAAGTVADAAARPDLVTGQRQFNIMSEKDAIYRAAFRYSRGQEDEADKLGVLYAALAGFDPEAGARMWTRAAADSGGARPLRAVLFDDHPADAARAENTAKYARLVRPYFVRGQQNPRAREIIADNAL